MGFMSELNIITQMADQGYQHLLTEEDQALLVQFWEPDPFEDYDDEANHLDFTDEEIALFSQTTTANDFQF